jgi:hypothetical protein
MTMHTADDRSIVMPSFDLDPDLTRRVENMSEMMRRLGLDAADPRRNGGATVLATAAEVCEACRVGNECRDWLKRAAATLCKAPGFCPNAERFAKLTEEAAWDSVAR